MVRLSRILVSQNKEHNMIIPIPGSSGIASVASAGGGVGGWQRWAPYAAVAWSFIYGALGVRLCILTLTPFFVYN
jgi:hypothetical protein